MSVTAAQIVCRDGGDRPSPEDEREANDNGRPDGATIAEIAREMQLTDRQVRRICRAVENKIRRIPEARELLDLWNELGREK